MARFNHQNMQHQHQANMQNQNDQADGGAVMPAPTPVPPTPAPTSMPPADANPGNAGAAPAFSDLGATFNDATRALEGGLWQSTVNEGGQGLGSVGRYTSDLTNVQNGLTAGVNAGQFSGDTLTHLQTMLSDITTALSAASASVNGGGSFGSVAAAEKALHDSHLDILNTVQHDQTLSAMATQNGATGFMAAPAALPNGTTAANAPHATLADIGAIFNDAANHILGGVNADNQGVIQQDISAVIKDMQGLMKAQPDAFQNLTGVHADTIINQLQLEKTFVDQAATNPVAGRASNDNMLDIIDIVQGDTNLAAMATHNGVSGFSAFPDALNPTPKYMDNAAQTNFWADFIAQSNSLGQKAIAAVGGQDHQAINALVQDLNTFQNNATKFDASQGGIFEARFDNELLGNKSTLGAEVSAMVNGLHAGNAALVTAAADEMHANAADVSGNNIPSTGGIYNVDGLTVADALSTAGGGAAGTPVATAPATPSPTQVAQSTPPAAGGANPAPAGMANVGNGNNAGQATGQADAGNGHTPAQSAVADAGNHGQFDPAGMHGNQPSPLADMAQHFHHMWG
jgi:hypothetical protein